MRVLLAGGGSGGSATPVLAVAEALRARDPSVRISYVGTSGGPERALVEAAGIPFYSVPTGKLRRYVDMQNIWDVGNVALGILRSLRLVRRLRPDVAFGAGGFACVPPLWAAKLSGVPVHIHPQDVIPGLANKLLVSAAASISVTFSESLPHFPALKTTVVGNPVRRIVLEGNRDRFFGQLNFNPELPFVLITGGGTGALRLNQLVAAASERLVEHVQVLHLTGQGREVEPRFESERYVQRAFLVHEMADALKAASVVVSRAGLGTLSEIGALGLSAIVIPMPRSHQLPNARTFADADAAVVLNEESLTSDLLAEEILRLVSDEERRVRLGAAARRLLPLDAAERVANQLRTIAKA
jgi:UDP-N-acetylglucosamine--N-acetylmuramyl-(pentapeptide) pyrophosphoryl-undecaprenol N-acetylglucosamine transferase